MARNAVQSPLLLDGDAAARPWGAVIISRPQLALILAAWALLLNLTAALPAEAITVAVFPVDDLSSAFNSLSQPMTEFLREEMARRGLTVISSQELDDFMTRHRLRMLGALPSEDITAAKAELKADLILLGSVCQKDDQAGTLGLMVSLIRTADAQTIWASDKGLSLLDGQRLLGIHAPTGMGDLQGELERELFASWPPDDRLAAQLAEAQTGPEAGGGLEVDSVFFTPKRVRPGQEVKCTIHFKVKQNLAQARVFIRVGSRIHMATTDDGVYYQVSWIGSDDKNGRPLKVAMNAPDGRIINGIWSGAPQDAEYPVSLILEWPSGRQDETYVGSYVVDSVPPSVRFKSPEGPKVEGLAAFRSELALPVCLDRPEPIGQWEFLVTGPGDLIVARDQGTGQPPAELIWRGQNQRGARADPGRYLARLKVWDLAGNLGEAQEAVLLLPAQPGANLTLAGQPNQPLKARLTPRDGMRITYWRLELWSADNVSLGTFEGQGLPARFALPRLDPTRSPGGIGCLLVVRDALGDESRRKIADLQALTKTKTGGGTGKAAPKAQGGWQSDF